MTNQENTSAVEAVAPIGTFAQWLGVVEEWRAVGGAKGFEKSRKQFINKNAASTVEAFNAWLDKPEVWNGTDRPAIGTPSYDLAKKSLGYVRNISGTMSEPWRATFCAWAMESPELTKILAESMKEGAIPDYHLLRADIFKACGEAMCERDENGVATRKSKMFDSEKNNTYLTKNSKGEWVPISEDAVAKLARDPNGPRLLVTGTHAFYETMDDLNPIPEMYEDIARETAPGTHFVPFDRKPSKNDTVVICAAHTRENNFLNLEDLFRRVSDVTYLRDHPEAKDDFLHTSQMAVQMNALVLKAIAADDNEMKRINKSKCTDGALQPNGEHGLMMHDGTGDNPLKLHANAAEIVRKINFCGFSKMGNAIYDGSRFLEYQLEATDGQEHPLVQCEKGTTGDILENLSLTGGSFNETGRKSKSQFTKIQNRSDLIAVEDETPYSEFNQLFMYDSGEDQKNFGHTFAHKLKGVLGNPAIFDAFATIFAPHAGKASIAHVEYNAGHESLLLTTSQTTDQELFMNRRHQLEEALRRKGLGEAVVVNNGATNSKRFEVRGIDLHSTQTIRKLEEAFSDLTTNPESGIRLSDNILGLELPAIRIEAARATHQGARMPDGTGKVETHEMNGFSAKPEGFEWRERATTRQGPSNSRIAAPSGDGLQIG
jgi:hypothetical protein